MLYFKNSLLAITQTTMRSYILSYFLFLSIISMMNSCGDCDSFANACKKDNFNFVLMQKPSSGRCYDLQGINPISGKSESYYESGGFLNIPFKSLISVGDTLIKKEGELRVFIHKRDTVLVYHFECDGKIYD